MAGNEVRLKFTGDTTDLTQGLGRVEDGMDGVTKAASRAEDGGKKFGRSVDDVSDGLGNASGKFRDTNDLVSGFADTVGLALPPQAQMLMGFADMADGMSGLLGPALTKGKAAFQALNATMKANPILSIIAIIVLLVGAFIVLYKNSETFRNAVDALGRVFKSVMDKILDAAKVVFGWIKEKWPLILGLLTGPIGLAVLAIVKHWDKIKDAVVKVKDTIVNAFKSAGQGIKDAIGAAVDWVMNRFQPILSTMKKIAEFSPAGLAGKAIGKFNPFANGGVIPKLANGGMFPGVSLVGERGPELLVGGGGGRVLSHTDSMKAVGGGGGGSTTIQVVVDGRVITETVYNGLLEKQRRTGRLGLA